MSGAFSSFEWGIAGRYLRARRRDGYLSVITIISFLGIMLGVGTLIVVMAVMNGFRADLLDRILGMNGHATIRSFDGSFDDRAGLMARLQKIDDVRRVNALIDGQVLVSTPRGVRGAFVRGLSRPDMKALPSLADNIIGGSLDNLKPRDVILGVRLAEYFQLKIGDSLALISPRGVETPFGTAPRIQNYRIGALFRVGLSDYDIGVVFMDIDAAARLTGQGSASGAIEVSLTNPERIDVRIPALKETIGDAHYLIDWKSANATLSGALKVERNVMFLILTLILLVASLNIVSGMVMLVRNKTRDIAVLRSMGASRAMILRVFFITGATIGVFGTICGVGLGMLASAYIEEIRQFLIFITGAELFPANVYFLDSLPARIEWRETLAVVAMALTLSFLSTLYPAWRAASLQPVEALRYE